MKQLRLAEVEFQARVIIVVNFPPLYSFYFNYSINRQNLVHRFIVKQLYKTDTRFTIPPGIEG